MKIGRLRITKTGPVIVIELEPKKKKDSIINSLIEDIVSLKQSRDMQSKLWYMDKSVTAPLITDVHKLQGDVGYLQLQIELAPTVKSEMSTRLKNIEESLATVVKVLDTITKK